VPDAALAAAAAAAAPGADPDAYDAAETAPVPERWLPHAVRVTVRAAGGVAVEQADAAEALQPSAAEAAAAVAAGDVWAVYELGGMVALIRPRSGEAEAAGGSGSAAEAQRREEGHLVAIVRVRPPYVERAGAFAAADAGAPPPLTPGVSPLVRGVAPRAPPGAPPPAPVPEEEARAVTPPPAEAADAELEEDAEAAAAAAAEEAAGLRTPQPGARGAAAAEQRTPGGAPAPADAPTSDWVVLNDFTVTPVARDEVAQLYGASKQPCVLLFTRADAPPPPPLPPPVMTEAAYARLTRARPPPPGATWRPLDMGAERPRPGMLLGIDAEFVALSPADKAVRPDGSEQVLRPPRLGLARVSVVRGAGPAAGVPLQDDYVRAVEPVHDYLTRYSGLQPGDLDPAAARHANGVTSLKAAYLKLRYLVDAGCRFCGHGLSSDFRCINMLVPPAQLVDTVELFRFKRQRKLSLRFLARYLLGADIQRGSHDSIEDARTALALYAKYTQLCEAGALQATLLEMYRFGKQYGWDGSAPAAVWPLAAQQQA
jgi:PAB-dependent poly(A)-specific ribonuclease subunit 2